VLGGLESTYGKFFIYGNHDNQLPDSRMKRTYSDDELREAINANGIKILCDDVEEINDDLLLVGRDSAIQFFPVEIVIRTKYPVAKGKTEIGDMTMIVSSGFSGWGYPYRTESHCEYEVIDIQPKQHS
jgi:predicted MPP superfamily phosphohydrolase